MKKKINILLITFIIFIGCIDIVKAENVCTKEAAEQLAKIVYHENGIDAAVNSDDNFFSKLTTASIVLNNASSKSGNSWYEKIYNLTDNNYQDYSSYKDLSFSDVVDSDYQGEMLYIAELVLSGKYNISKNIVLQASESIVKEYGKVWTYVDFKSGYYDIYYGYTGSSLSSNNVFDEKLEDTSADYFKNKAKSLKLTSYSKYNSSTVCSNISNNKQQDTSNTNNTNNTSTSNSSAFEVCTNPDILRVIYFILLIIDIVRIIVPIALIILGLVDFSKSVVISDENTQKTNAKLFGKRLLNAALVFLVPWMVKVLMITLGNLFGDENSINYTDCIENANKETIEALEDSKTGEVCYYCPVTNTYIWQEKVPSENCPGGINWSVKSNVTKNNCKSNEISSNENKNIYDYTVYVGDSRTVGMCDSVKLTSNENCTISKIGAGYSWLSSDDTTGKIKNLVQVHPNSYIVINMGTNSALTTSEGKEYATFYNNIAEKYQSSKVVAVSVTQVDYNAAKRSGMYSNINLNENSVSNFNTSLKSNLKSNIIYCDVYAKMENYDYVATDGVHYNSDTYKFIYSEIQKCLK